MNYTQENGINNGESSGEPERIELHHDWNNPAAHSNITTSDSGNGDNIDDSGDGDDVDAGSGDNGDGSDVGDGGDSGNDNSDSSVIDNDEDFDDLPPLTPMPTSYGRRGFSFYAFSFIHGDRTPPAWMENLELLFASLGLVVVTESREGEEKGQ